LRFLHLRKHRKRFGLGIGRRGGTRNEPRFRGNRTARGRCIRNEIVETHRGENAQASVSIVEHERHGTRLRSLAKRRQDRTVGEIQHRRAFADALRNRDERREHESQTRRTQSSSARELIAKRRRGIDIGRNAGRNGSAHRQSAFHGFFDGLSKPPRSGRSRDTGHNVTAATQVTEQLCFAGQSDEMSTKRGFEGRSSRRRGLHQAHAGTHARELVKRTNF
jgi:hypothetical protein